MERASEKKERKGDNKAHRQNFEDFRYFIKLNIDGVAIRSN